MTRDELIKGQIEVITKNIEVTNDYLSSYPAQLHRNIRKSQERRLGQLKHKRDALLSGVWTDTDELHYQNLYAHKPFNITYISAL